MSVLFGLGFDYVGLPAVMIAHTIVDIIGLYLVRHLAERKA
ncbi:hypothetical protein [Massilia eburnea]